MASVELDGVWYKRCMECGEWTSYEDLVFEWASEQHDCGRDLCPKCGPGLPNENDNGMLVKLVIT